MRFFFQSERTEEIAIQLKMSGDVAQEVKDIIELSGCRDLNFSVIYPDDTVKIDWDFTVKYYDAIRQIQALTQLLNHPGVRAANMNEKHGKKILLEELINALREAEVAIANRLNDENVEKGK